MSDATSNPIDPNAPSEDELPQAKLVRAQDLAPTTKPKIRTWQFQDLKQAEDHKEQKVRSEVIAQIRKEAEPELKRQTTLLKKEAYENAHQEGYDAGFQKGLALGQKEAFEKAAQEAKNQLEPLVKRMESLMGFMQNPYRELENSVFESFSHLAIEIAEKFIEKEIIQDREWALNSVKKAIEVLPDDPVTLEIEMHPDDVELIESYQSEFSQNWHVVSSPSMALGSCRVKQNFSIVDNVWQTQLSDYLSGIRERADSNASQKSPTDSPNEAALTPQVSATDPVISSKEG